MSRGLSIREATEADLPAIAMLYESAGLDAPGVNDPETLTAAWTRLRREAPTAQVLIAELDGAPAGTLCFYRIPMLGHGGGSAALVESVAVAASAQGTGVGRALMDVAMERARASGCYKLALSSKATRTKAHVFYERLGYARHGVSFVTTVDGSIP